MKWIDAAVVFIDYNFLVSAVDRKCVSSWVDVHGASRIRTCLQCETIPRIDTFSSRLTTAIQASVQHGVEQGSRSISEAGGAEHMKRSELVVCATTSSSALRVVNQRVAMMRATIHRLKTKDPLEVLIQRNNPQVCPCPCARQCGAVLPQ
jgi:hypothetical protein